MLAVLVHGAVDGWYGTATRSFTPSGLAQFSLYAALAALAVAAALVGGLTATRVSPAGTRAVGSTLAWALHPRVQFLARCGSGNHIHESQGRKRPSCPRRYSREH